MYVLKSSRGALYVERLSPDWVAWGSDPRKAKKFKFIADLWEYFDAANPEGRSWDRDDFTWEYIEPKVIPNRVGTYHLFIRGELASRPWSPLTMVGSAKYFHYVGSFPAGNEWSDICKMFGMLVGEGNVTYRFTPPAS